MSNEKSSLSEVTLFPFWLDNPNAPDVTPNLVGATETDLLIIGGGFTGLWAAVQAKEANPQQDVVLIEAGKVAYGASGRPGAIVSTSVMHGLSNAKRIFPNDLDKLEELGRENMSGFLGTLERHDIDCQAEWGGELTVALDGGVEGLKHEYDLHATHGHEPLWLDQDAIQDEVRSPLYRAGIWMPNNSGTVHPALLAWGLKRVAIQLGVRFHELTPMIKIEDLGSCLKVKTHDGEIKSPKVLLATNAFASGHKNIRKRVVAIRDRLIATEPLNAEQMDSIGWKNRQGIYDTRTQLNYTRLSKDNRIIFGGRLGYFFNGNTDPEEDRNPEVYERLAGAFFKTFPQLNGIKFSHAWSGPIGLTTRMAVHFQRYYGNKAVYAGGYSGFGVSGSRFGARIGLDILDGKSSPELDMAFAKSMPNWIPPEPFRLIGARISLYALDTADEKGGWRHPWIKFVRGMGFPI